MKQEVISESKFSETLNSCFSLLKNFDMYQLRKQISKQYT